MSNFWAAVSPGAARPQALKLLFSRGWERSRRAVVSVPVLLQTGHALFRGREASVVRSKMPMNLSDQQTQAIGHRGTHLRIVACAGSGKTEVMARRVAGLIGEGVAPASIVAFTFTERAAASLRNRIHKRI